MECDPLRRLGADARQLAELVDEVLDDAFVHGDNCSSRVRRGTPDPTCLRARHRFGLSRSAAAAPPATASVSALNNMSIVVTNPATLKEAQPDLDEETHGPAA
ncbi:hypothetical protein GCM10009625_22750 [Brachybacterium fresconis]